MAGLREMVKDAGLSCCLALGAVARPPGAPVLVYHSIDSSGSYLSISPEMFLIQMSYLKRAGFRGIALREFLALPEPGGKAVALTFDDGLLNFREAAWPILKEHGFSATVFVPTDFIGKDAAWYAAHELPVLPIMDWEDLRALNAEGAEIGSHGCSHAKLTGVAPADLQRELAESKQLLEQGLGVSVDAFCYPYGAVNRVIRDAAAEAGYRACCSMEQGLHRPGDDVHMIRRESLDLIAVEDEQTALLSIRACLQGSFAWYVRAKRLVKRALSGLAGFSRTPGSSAPPSSRRCTSP